METTLSRCRNAAAYFFRQIAIFKSIFTCFKKLIGPLQKNTAQIFYTFRGLVGIRVHSVKSAFYPSIFTTAVRLVEILVTVSVLEKVPAD